MQLYAAQLQTGWLDFPSEQYAVLALTDKDSFGGGGRMSKQSFERQAKTWWVVGLDDLARYRL